MQSSKFFSITKFVEKLNEKKNFIKKSYPIDEPKILVYFEGIDVYKNKFGITIKPLFIRIKDTLDMINIKYDEILEIFETDPIISFKENKSRYIPAIKDKKNMFILEIFLNQQEFNNIKYFPSSMRQCTCISNVEKIRKIVNDLQKSDEVEDIISF